jgi:NAD(P)-dependent dehydrogenase (short-subunit alcohol dehydrogenase family)
MSYNFKNKTIFITGGTSGIGKATAKQFIKYGAKVIITGRNQATLDEVQVEMGENLLTIQLDQSDISQILGLQEKLKTLTPSLDGVFLNAGNGDISPIESVTENHFDLQFNSLVKGNFFTAQQLIPLINKNGSIVFNVSYLTEIGYAGTSILSAAKGAVKSLVKSFARELANTTIRVNAVSPGLIETAFLSKTSLSSEQLQEVAKSAIKDIPLNRFGSSQEIANVVTFLMSENASYIHGVEIPVNGGMTQI